MVKNQDKNEITLRCKPLDLQDPTMLSCEIIPKSVPRAKGAGTEAALMTPQPDQSESDTVKPLSVVTGDNGKQGYEIVNVRKVRKDGKVFLEVLNPDGIDKTKAEDTLPNQKTEPNLMEMKHRLARVNKCIDKSCVVSKFTSRRQNQPENRDGTEDGEGG